MTPLDALLELLAGVGASGGAAVLVNEVELSRWPAEAVRKLKSQKLLVRASPATSVICPGCERECVMPVHTPPARNGPAASFVVCDKRDDINRVEVPSERLKQWRCGAEAVGAFVVQSLGLRSGAQRMADAGLLELGLVKGKRRSQMVCLRACEVPELVAGGNTVPLAELVRYGVEGYSVDFEAIRQLVEASGLDRTHWSTAAPIRAIFREAFERAGLPYFNPHSVRKTLARLGEQVCKSPEDFKAWSQNLGHEQVLTTFLSYGSVASDRQGAIIRGLGTIRQPEQLGADDIAEAVVRKLQSAGTGLPGAL